MDFMDEKILQLKAVQKGQERKSHLLENQLLIQGEEVGLVEIPLFSGK